MYALYRARKNVEALTTQEMVAVEDLVVEVEEEAVIEGELQIRDKVEASENEFEP